MSDDSHAAAGHPAFGAADLEELTWQWRRTLDAAQSAIGAASGYVRPETVRLERAHLAGERTAVARTLDAVAHVHHLDVPVSHLALPASGLRRLLGLPSDVAACVFTLDGVLVPSAAVHAAAWKETFDEFIFERVERTRGRFTPFDPVGDYFVHLHGKPRLEGVRAFLASRGIRLEEGTPDDPPGVETVHGLANRKGEALVRRLATHHLHAFAGTRYYLEVAREAGIHRVVVSASTNAPQMLETAGMSALVEQCIDGSVMASEHLRAKPAPDTLLAACAMVEAEPQHSVVFETTPAGVVAAREAGFELVVGVTMEAGSGRLPVAGADRVVGGLAELLEPRHAG